MQNQAANSSSSGDSNGSNPNAGATEAARAEQPRGLDWPCSFCPKTFKSSQGLGGHQNAHRRERDKQMKELYAKNNACRRLVPLRPSPSLRAGRGLHHGLAPWYPSGPSHGPAPGFGLAPRSGAEPMIGTGPRLGFPPNTGYFAGSWFAPEIGHRVGPWLDHGHMVGHGPSHGPGPHMAHPEQVQRMVGPHPLHGDQSVVTLTYPELKNSNKNESPEVEAGVEVNSEELDLDLRL